jgi:hypothetical protein
MNMVHHEWAVIFLLVIAAALEFVKGMSDSYAVIRFSPL